MKRRNEVTVTLRELPARSLLKRVQDIHDAIARRAYHLSTSRGLSDGHDWQIGSWPTPDLSNWLPLEISDRLRGLNR
jgi:hypothetical protein